MFRINSMELVGLEDKEGIVMSWMPDGLSMEMSNYKVITSRMRLLNSTVYSNPYNMEYQVFTVLEYKIQGRVLSSGYTYISILSVLLVKASSDVFECICIFSC